MSLTLPMTMDLKSTKAIGKMFYASHISVTNSSASKGLFNYFTKKCHHLLQNVNYLGAEEYYC